MHILLTDSDPVAATQLGDYLELRGHTVDYAAQGTLAWRLMTAHDFQAVVIAHRFRLDSRELCRRLRLIPGKRPVILIIGDQPSVSNTVDAFEAGADDYLARPVALAEVHARLNGFSRRGRRLAHNRLVVGDLVVDLDTREVRRDGRLLALTPTEFKLLRVLMETAPRVVTYGELESCMWGTIHASPSQTNLRAQIYNLRQCIDRPFGRPLIETHRSIGYRIALRDEGRGRVARARIPHAPSRFCLRQAADHRRDPQTGPCTGGEDDTESLAGEQDGASRHA